MANDRPPDGEPPARQPGWRPAQDRPTPAPQESTSASRGITIELSPRSIRIEPGEVVTASIKVRNMGAVVDEITLTPRGEAGGWMRIAPDTLNIYPNTEGEATIRFAPQRAPRPPAGLFAFEIAVNSDRQPDSSMIYRGSVELGSYDNLSAAAAGSTYLTGRRDAILPIKVRNQGNRPTTVQVSAADLPGATVLLSSPSFVLEPGGEATVWATIKPRAGFMSGPPRQHPFTISVASDYSAPLTIDGRMEQLARFSRKRLVALAVIGAVLLTVGGGLVANAFGLIVLPGTGPTASPTNIADVTPSPTFGPTGSSGPTDTPANKTDEPTGGPTDGPTPIATVTEPPTPTVDPYIGWDPMGGEFSGEFSQSGTASSWDVDRLQVIAPWSDGNLYTSAWAGAGWSPWEPLGSPFTTRQKPSTVAWNDPGSFGLALNVFAVGDDRAIYQASYQDGLGWTGWTSLGGSFAAGPGAASWGIGRLDVFGRSSEDNTLQHNWYDGGTWNSWEMWTPDVLRFAPAAVAWSTGGEFPTFHIAVFAIHSDSAMYELDYDSSVGFGAWRPLGGSFSSGPAVTAWGADHFDVFARSDDGVSLLQNTLDAGSWSGWQQLTDIRLAGAPAATAWAPGRIDLFAVGEDNQMHHRWFDGGAWRP